MAWMDYVLDIFMLVLGIGAAITAFFIGWKMTGIHLPAEGKPPFSPSSALDAPVFSPLSFSLQEGPNGLCIVLLLENSGAAGIFEYLRPGAGGELRPIPQLANRMPLKSGMVIGSGEQVRVVLEGSNAGSRPYQFSIFFSDLTGNQFRQEISGIGADHPLVDRTLVV